MMKCHTRTDKIIDNAKEAGWNVEYDENCGRCTTIIGHITFTKDNREIIMGVRCSEEEGLVFSQSGSTFKTLWETETHLKR